MKKPLLLIIVSLLLISCYSITQVSSKTYNYTKNIDFSIIKTEESKIKPKTNILKTLVFIFLENIEPRYLKSNN